jgi:hypothetical protein
VGFPAEKANSCWTVLGGLLLFNALQSYETDANNNRSQALGVRRCKDSDIFFGGAITVSWNQENDCLLPS